jgi:hypothetical protein
MLIRHLKSWVGEEQTCVRWFPSCHFMEKCLLTFSRHFVVENINEGRSANPMSAPIAYFYCARNAAEPQRADPDEILRCLLKQLSCSRSKLPIREPLAGTYKQRKEDADDYGYEPVRLSRQECVEHIICLLETIPVTIVIDALDECDPSRRHELLSALNTIYDESRSLVKIFVSSRDNDDIARRLVTSTDIFIQAKDNSEDIERYIRSEVDCSIKEMRLLGGNVSSDLKRKIIATLIEGAQGM